jgi:hypothetical protein
MKKLSSVLALLATSLHTFSQRKVIIISSVIILFAHSRSSCQCANPPTAFIGYTEYGCGVECFLVQASGGTPPYSFNIPNGPEIESNNFLCLNQNGTFELIVTDALGCVGDTTFTIDISSTNSICEYATPLPNSVAIVDTLCHYSMIGSSCFQESLFFNGWFQFNSQDFTHFQFNVHAEFYNDQYNANGLRVLILESGNNGTCENAVEVFCDNVTAPINLEDYFTITPNSNYYIRLMAVPYTTPITTIGILMGYSQVEGAFGCTNPLSCHFDPEAIINDGSCGTDGCTDASACNYMSWATCDDGSCILGNDIYGVFYNDFNGNGTRDSWPILEPALSSAGYITIDELNITIYPDASGSFVLPDLELGSYSVTFHNTAGNWVLTGGDNTLTITLPTCNGLLIGLVPTSGVSAQISGTNMFATSLIQCNNGFLPGAYISNTGTVPISGTFTITGNPLFTAQTVSYGEPFTNPAPGVFEWQIENMLPGTYLNLIAHVNGPGVDYVGQSFPFTFDLELSDGTQIFYSNTWTTNALVSCAYDPNDKQATPEGYTENHFILEDTELQYKIRFQNTGNAPAFDVVIEDQIDIARLDLTTLEPLNASHSFSTIVQPDGLVKFVFNNIMLPDSTSNEPESHGYVIYKIRTMPGIEVGEVINNTAAIFFDDNPPIITNTAFHEIYSCDEIPQFDEQLTLCTNDLFSQVITYPHIESITWLVNDQLAGNALNFTELANFGESWNIEMIIENPLCEVTSQWTIEELPLPSNNVIEGIQGQLTASTGVAWQWYNADGTIIPGATEQTFGSSIAGAYYVVITGENGCTSQSELFTIVSVDEFDSNSITAFPNPVFDNLQLQVSQALIGSEYSVHDVTGRVVMRGKINAINSEIDFSQQSSGSYIIKVGNANVRVQK